MLNIYENFFSHLPMGVTPSENSKIPLLRKFISESVFFFLKKLTYFGSSFSKTLFRKFTSEILRFLQIYQNTPLPQSFTLNQNKKWQKRKFVQTEFQSCIKAPITLLNNIQKPSILTFCKF